MGYPKANVGGLAAAIGSGLSYASGSSGTLAGIPALSPNALKLLGRAFPWVGAVMTAYTLAELYRARNPLSFATGILCGGGLGDLGPYRFGDASACGTSLVGTSGGGVIITYTALVTRYRYSYGQSAIMPSPFIGTVSSSHLVTVPKGQQSALAGAPYAPAFVSQFVDVPWHDPTKPIKSPVPYFRPLPWRVLPYKPANPWDPSPLPDPPRRPLPRPPRPTPQPDPLPDDRPGPIPRPEPKPEPKPKPGDPVPDPNPDDPSPQPDPNPDPDVNLDWYPSPSPDGWLTTRGQPSSRSRIRERTDPRSRGRADTGVKLEVRGPEKYQLKPPKKGVKEIKVRAGAAMSAAWSAINAITEVRDAVKSIHDALPKFCKGKKKVKGPAFSKFSARTGPTLQQMAMDIYGCVGANHGINTGKRHMTREEEMKFLNDAIDNLITDQIKDHVLGKFGKAVGQGSRVQGRPIGYTAGPAL